MKSLLIATTVVPPAIALTCFAWLDSLLVLFGIGIPVAFIVMMRLETSFVRAGRQDLLVWLGRVAIGVAIVFAIMAMFISASLRP